MLEISDFTRLRVLKEEGSFNKAAPKLSMSQPALSKRIARLEDMLGIKLFYRSNKGIIPTEFGRKITTEGSLISRQVVILERELVMMAGKDIGTLRLGVGPVIEEEILPATLGKFLKKYPNIGFDIKVDNATNLITLLKEGRIDIAVGAFSDIDQYPDFHIQLLGRNNIIFVARPRHPLFTSSHIGLQQILEYPLAVPDIPHTIEAWFDSQPNISLSRDRYIFSENYRLLTAVAKSTNHIIAGPDILFSADIENGQLKVIPLAEFPMWEAYIVSRPEAIHAPLVQSLSTMIKEVFLALQPDYTGC